MSVGLVGIAGPQAMAGSHSWRINEVFSNADGTIQFIELKECCGAANEIFLTGKWVRSQATGNEFLFPGNLPPGSTANKHLLLATPGFAALPGAPTPDYIIPAGFFAINGDTIEYWFYTPATLTFGPGELPTDCITSLHDGGAGPNFTGPNSPTNFAGETASVDACPCPWDLDGSGDVGILDLLALLAAWGPCQVCVPSCDLDGDCNVGILDLLILLANWGLCP
ncbi:MAG: hypothetical protein IH889_02765 [Planctomycetes bacterium]|nr:hypothetical protein [Planctomycetota bacterium]